MTSSKRADLILTADPDYFSQAIAELREAQPQMTIINELAPGVMLVATQAGFFDLAEVWRHQPPTFVRHIAPIQFIHPYETENHLIDELKKLILEEVAPFFDPELPFSVQSRCFGEISLKPSHLNKPLAAAINSISKAPLDVKNPVQILSIGVGNTAVYLGLSLAQQNLSNWAGGERRFAKEKGLISRAEFKLLEAVEQFGIHLPPRGRALDLGASPGGWTRVLRQKGQLVTAVDPGELHPSLRHDSAIRHLPIAAEKYLTQYPDTYDLIVNDMRLDARDSARLMVSYAPYLYSHGDAIMTLKLPINDPLKPFHHALNILSEAYEIAKTRQLFHNRKEVTVHLKKPTYK